MTDKKILEKAIQKAIDGGWKPNNLDPTKDIRGGMKGMTGHVIQFKHGLADYRAVIFSHEFAKSLWGESLTLPMWNDGKYEWKSNTKFPAYMAHLMCMVTTENPIEYLGDNL